MIGQPTPITNGKSLCTDLLFSTNSKLLYEDGIEQTVYGECYHSMIYVSPNFNIFFLHFTLGKFTVTKTKS